MTDQSAEKSTLSRRAFLKSISVGLGTLATPRGKEQEKSTLELIPPIIVGVVYKSSPERTGDFEGAPSLKVTLYEKPEDPENLNPRKVLETLTDSEGVFNFHNVDEGQYLVQYDTGNDRAQRRIEVSIKKDTLIAQPIFISLRAPTSEPKPQGNLQRV